MIKFRDSPDFSDEDTSCSEEARLRAGVRTARWFEFSWKNGAMNLVPYRHWLLKDALPADVARAVTLLPISPTAIEDTQGRRDSHNSSRTFFTRENCQKLAVCDVIALAFQSPKLVAQLTRSTGVNFVGSYLRIEYCQDGDGFWLEPHTDIGAKLLTLTVYLSDTPGCEHWGTDVYDSNRKHVYRVPAAYNNAYAFVPSSDTWHGVERRSFLGVRRSIIVNYVKPEWRSRHELAFPDIPIE